MFYEGLNLLQANLKSKKQTFARKLMCQVPSYALIFPIPKCMKVLRRLQMMKQACVSNKQFCD